MALRLVFGWVGLNVGALLLLALVDVFRAAAKGMVRVLRGTRRLEKAPG
jgi:hypothetical protein